MGRYFSCLYFNGDLIKTPLKFARKSVITSDSTQRMWLLSPALTSVNEPADIRKCYKWKIKIVPANITAVDLPWWRHQMETFSALLALCVGNSLVTVEFPAQRPVTRSFDVFFNLGLSKPLCKQSWCWCSETPSCHWNVIVTHKFAQHMLISSKLNIWNTMI